MFQDALILHIIYAIWINPETFVLLTFDSIDKNGKMRYFDTMKLKYRVFHKKMSLFFTKNDTQFLKKWHSIS